MEDLIEEFLEELIDKNEITVNERTDMKLTLLEAMPREMTEETKGRVMSSLKSKMETPSANIFTDKGVNIDAVRTIANESVKEVVKAVEKEEQAKVEAEAKRDAKVSEAIDSIILDADKKEDISKAQETVNEKNEEDDLYYEDPIYSKVSNASIQQAYKEIEVEYEGRKIDKDLKMKFVLSKASYLDYNNLVKKYVEQGMSISDAIATALSEKSDGNAAMIEVNRDKFLQDAVYRVLTYLDTAVEQKMNVYEYINVVLKEHADEFIGIENLDVLVEKVFEFYSTKAGLDESYLKGEKDTVEIVEKTDNAKQPDELDESQITEIIKASIIKELYEGYGFEDAYERAMQKYEKYFISLENIFDFVSDLRDDLLALGFTDEELENGNIDKKKLEVYVSENIKDDIIQVEESKTELDDTKSVDENDENFDQNNGMDKLNKVLSITGSLFKEVGRNDSGFEFVKSARDTMYEQNVKDYEEKVLTIQNNKDRDGFTLVNRYTYEKRMIDVQYLLAKENRKIEEEDYANGELSTERKNLIEQRNYYIKKATKLYMTGEKSVHEILAELGKYAVKFEIIPKDIIDCANSIVKKNNPKLTKEISSNETNIMYKQIWLKVAYEELESLKSNGVEKPGLIEKIEKTEREVAELRNKVTAIKVQSGTFDKDRAEELEVDLLTDIETSYNLTNKFKKLIDMQGLYLDIQKRSKEKGISMESAAKIILGEKKDSRELFGRELVEAMNKYDDGEVIAVFPLVKEGLKRVNDQYKELVEQNIINLDRTILKSTMVDAIDIDCTAAILEKERFSREAKRADKRDLVLTKSNEALDRKELTNVKNRYLKQAVETYYEKDCTVVDIYESFKAQGKKIELNDIIKGILLVAEKLGVGTKDQHKDFATKEVEAFNEHLKINAWDSLRKNARNDSNLTMVETFDEDIEKSKRIIVQNLQENSLLRAAVRERDEEYKNIFGVELFENESQIRKLKRSKGSGIKGNGRFKRNDRYKKASEVYGDEQKKYSEQPKGVGLMNVAKILETSGTTSQEIVGEVTDLNKFARVQDERGITEEQRDS